jgi:hypothetical protein
LIAGEMSGSVSTTSAMPADNTQDGIAAVPITFSRTHEITHPCPRGGTVQLTWRVDGSLDVERVRSSSTLMAPTSPVRVHISMKA